MTKKQKIFADEYLIDLNATRAYKVAYPSVKKDETAAQAGSRMLRNVEVKEEIIRLKQERLNREFLSEADIFQKYMDIAFSDITDYVKFGTEEVPVMAMYGPVQIKDPQTGEKKPLTETVNIIHFRDSSEVDGTIISEVKHGKNGSSIKLVDRMKALQWLSDHMDLGTEEQKAKIAQIKAQTEIMRLKAQTDKDEEMEDDGFLEALKGTAAEDWKNEETDI